MLSFRSNIEVKLGFLKKVDIFYFNINHEKQLFDTIKK